MKNTALIICVLIIIAGMLYIITSPEPEPIIHTETIFNTDTIFVPSEPEVIIKQVEILKYDTIVFKDTIYLTEVAEMDTSFKEGDLSIKYYYEPKVFNVIWNPKPMPVITNTITNTVHLPYNPRWYEKPQTGFIAGSLLTGFLIFLVK